MILASKFFTIGFLFFAAGAAVADNLIVPPRSTLSSCLRDVSNRDLLDEVDFRMGRNQSGRSERTAFKLDIVCSGAEMSIGVKNMSTLETARVVPISLGRVPYDFCETNKKWLDAHFAENYRIGQSIEFGICRIGALISFGLTDSGEIKVYPEIDYGWNSEQRCFQQRAILMPKNSG